LNLSHWRVVAEIRTHVGDAVIPASEHRFVREFQTIPRLLLPLLVQGFQDQRGGGAGEDGHDGDGHGGLDQRESPFTVPAH